MSTIEPTPTIQNILLTHRKVRNPSALVGGTDLEDTAESKELLKLETRLSKNLLAILTFIIRNENITRTVDNTNGTTTIKQNTKVGDLKRKYGFLFSNVFRSNIEDIYRLGGQYGMKFPELPILAYHTTDADLVLIRKYTKDYSQRIWFRIDRFLLNTGRRKPDAPPIRVDFIVNTLAAEIATFVMMEATKEKTRQVLALLNPNNLNSSLVSETASHTEKHKKEEELEEQELIALEAEADEAERAFDEDRREDDISAAVLTALIATRTLNEARKLNEQQYFMWQTARDDKVCFQYCKPLDGVLWKVKDLDEIPIPDQVTHPNCRCRLIKVRI